MVAALPVPFWNTSAGGVGWPSATLLACAGAEPAALLADDYPAGRSRPVRRLWHHDPYAARYDSAETSFFWTALRRHRHELSCRWWSPSVRLDMDATLCLTSTSGHLLAIMFDMAESSVLQPFAYIGVGTSAGRFPVLRRPGDGCDAGRRRDRHRRRPFTWRACRPAPPRLIPADCCPGRQTRHRHRHRSAIVESLPFTSSTAQLKTARCRGWFP